MVKNVFLISMMVSLIAMGMSGCGSSTSPEVDSPPSTNLRIFGTSGNEDVFVGGSDSRGMVWWEPQGGAEEVDMKFYRVWIGREADCSDIDPSSPIADYTMEPNGYKVFDLINDNLPIVTADLPAGSYNCLVFQVGGVLRIVPDDVAKNAFPACSGSDHLSAICHNDGNPGYRDLEGMSYECDSLSFAPVESDVHYLFLSTEPETVIVDGEPISRQQTIQLGSGVTVPGDAFLIVNFDEKINQVSDGTEYACEIDRPTIGFSMDPSVDSIKSWREVGNGPAIANEPHATRLSVDKRFTIVAQIYGTDVSSHLYSSHLNEWVSMSHKEGTPYTAGSIGVTHHGEKAYMVWIDQTPAQWRCKARGNCWHPDDTACTTDDDCTVSGLPFGTLAETTRLQIRLVSDDAHFYLAFAGTGAGRPVFAYRLPVGDIENGLASWTQIGGGPVGYSTVVPYGHEIAVHDGMLYVATYLQGTGITVKKSIDGADWQPVGDPFPLSANATSMSLSARFGDIYLAYVLRSGEHVHVHRFNTISDAWERVGAPDATGGDARNLHISSSSLFPYIAVRDTLNNNYPTLFTYKHDAWRSVPNSAIEELGTIIYDFDVFAGVPYILYWDGTECVWLKRFDSADD